MKDSIEEQRRKKFFQEMNEKKKRIQAEINQSRKTGRKLQINNRPNNIARVASKKISTDIVSQFKKARLDFYSKSTVTTAIQRQLVAYVDKGQGLLHEYNENLNVGKSNISQREIREGAIRVAQSKLSQYEELGEKIEDYNLRDNIIDTITNFLCPYKGLIQLGRSVPNLVDSDIAPTLNRLGLGDLIPELKQRLVERNEEESHGSMIAPEASIPYYRERVNADRKENMSENSTDEDGLGLDD